MAMSGGVVTYRERECAPFPMATTRIPDAVQRLFAEYFTARDIAEPLLSFDASAASADVREFMRANDFDVVGIRREGRVIGYIDGASLEDGACGQYQQPLEKAAVVSDSVPLLKIIMGLKNTPFLFVSVFGGVCGIITPSDLQKPSVRMWLFGIVTLIEMRCSQLVESHCPGDTWREYLSEGRLEKAKALLEERGRRNQKLRLFDCLQFSDKGQIV